MKKHLFIFFILFTSLIFAQSAKYQWGFNVGSSKFQNERTVKIATDNFGNFYTTGFYQDTANFNPNGTLTNLNGIGRECFLAKYNSNGVLLWAKNIALDNNQEGTSLVLKSNYLILVGNYSNGGGIDLDPGTGSVLTPTVNNTGMFISKFDLNGNFIWGKGINSFYTPVIKAVEVDNSDNIIICGNFQGTIDFDHSAGTATLAASNYDGFISKYDSNGNYLWAMKIGSTSTDFVNDICLDNNNNIYCTGSYVYTVNVNPLGTAVNLNTGGFGTSNAFIVKYGSNGVLKWANQIGSTSNDAGTFIKLDKQSNLLYGGNFGGVVDFDSGSGLNQLTSNNANYGLFISKIDTANNFLWAIDFGSSTTETINDVAIDTSNQIIATGYMSGMVNFNPQFTTNVSSHGGSDGYLAKYTSSGSLVWAYSIGGSGSDLGTSVDVNLTDNSIYLTGYYNSTNMDFDVSILNTSVPSNGSEDLYFAKYNQCEIVPSPVMTTPIANLVRCPGNSTILSATSTGTLTWYYGAINLGNGSSITTYTLNSPGTYTWSADNRTSCGTSSLATIVVTVNPKPNVQFTSPSYSTCANQTVAINVTGADNYSWTPIGLSGSSVVVTPTIAGNIPYVVSGSNTLGCIDTKTVFVYVASTPSFSIQSNLGNNICAGQSLTLSPSPIGTYTYLWSNGANTPSITVNPVNTSSYSLTITNNQNCSTIEDVTIIVNSPSISVSGNAILCSGQTSTLVASGVSTYTWSSGGNNSTIVVSPLTSTEYTVNGKDVLGCSAMAVFSVSVNSLPNLSIISTNSLLCSGQTATLSAFGASSYTWSTNENTTDIVVSPTITTSYSVSGADINGCINSTTISQDVSLCTNLADVSALNSLINIYPNPSKGIVNIHLSTSNNKITVLDVLGKVIVDEQFQEGIHSIDLHNHASGLYFIQVNNSEGSTTIRLIKE